MAVSAPNSVTWEEIDLCESYLVCGMFDEATTLASSVLMRIRDDEHISVGDYAMLRDMMESAAMVLIQSSGESRRAVELLNELKVYFGNVAAIPVQVLLTGACTLVAAGLTAIAREFIEGFLEKWKYGEGKYFIDMNLKLGVHTSSSEGPNGHLVLGVDEYMEVAQFYAVVLLCKTLSDLDHAIFWVEKAQLPEESRKDLLRNLHSLSSLEATSLSQASISPPLVVEPGSNLLPGKESSDSDKSEKPLSSKYSSSPEEKRKLVTKWQLKFRQQYHFLSWFDRATVKFGNHHLSLSTEHILKYVLVFLAVYVLQRKRASIVRLVKKSVLSLKQSMIDFWKLAFSYQVNPLAAVQALPAPATRSG